MRTYFKDPSFLREVRDKLYLLGGVGHVFFASCMLGGAVFTGFLEIAFSGHGQIGEHQHQVSGFTISLALIGVLGMGLAVPYFAVRRWARPLLLGIHALVFLGGMAGAYKIHLDYLEALEADAIYEKRTGINIEERGFCPGDCLGAKRDLTIRFVVLPSFFVFALLSAGRKSAPDGNQAP